MLMMALFMMMVILMIVMPVNRLMLMLTDIADDGENDENELGHLRHWLLCLTMFNSYILSKDIIAIIILISIIIIIVVIVSATIVIIIRVRRCTLRFFRVYSVASLATLGLGHCSISSDDEKVWLMILSPLLIQSSSLKDAICDFGGRVRGPSAAVCLGKSMKPWAVRCSETASGGLRPSYKTPLKIWTEG